MNPAWVIHTGRLVLSPVNGSDLPDLRAIKADPSVAWGIPELVRELKIEDMSVPIQNKR